MGASDQDTNMALWGTHVAIGGLGALLLIRAFRPDLRYAWVVVGLWAIVRGPPPGVPAATGGDEAGHPRHGGGERVLVPRVVAGSLLDYYDSQKRPWLSVPLMVAFLWVYAMAVLLERTD